MRLQPSTARCIEAKSARSPCMTSAPSRRRALARSSSRRTRARTLCPLASSNSVRLRPMPPTAPAAPVTRIGLSCVCFVVMSLTFLTVAKLISELVTALLACACRFACEQQGYCCDGEHNADDGKRVGKSQDQGLPPDDVADDHDGFVLGYCCVRDAVRHEVIGQLRDPLAHLIPRQRHGLPNNVGVKLLALG